MRTFEEHQPLIELWHLCHSVTYLTHTLISCIIKNNNNQKKEVKKMKQLINVLKEIKEEFKGIKEELKISNKINSSKLIADTIGIDTLRTLKDKQIESSYIFWNSPHNFGGYSLFCI